MARYYDTHVHLSDPEYATDMAVTLRQLEALGVVACCVSVDAESSARTLGLARSSGNVLAFAGIHPERASGDLDAMMEWITQNRDSISGIGEIGLDPTYPGADMARQAKVFGALLGVAERLALPVSIHSRKSLGAVFETMASYDCGRASLHWFDGGKRDLARAMEMGFYVSFGPVSVYANDKQSLLARADSSRILVETDGPVRFSRCFESRQAQPAFVPSVVLCAAKARGVPFEEMARTIEANSRAYIGI